MTMPFHILLATVRKLIGQWELENNSQFYNPIPILTSLSELIELCNKIYYKQDLDPFADLYICTRKCNSGLEQIAKVLISGTFFRTRLLDYYLTEDYYTGRYDTTGNIEELNAAACRLLWNLIPGIDAKAVFCENDSLIQLLIKWSTNSVEPLQTYATALLGDVMKIDAVAVNYTKVNINLVPLMIERLKSYEVGESQSNNDVDLESLSREPLSDFSLPSHSSTKSSMDKLEDGESFYSNDPVSGQIFPRLISSDVGERSNPSCNDFHFMFGTLQMHPLTTVTKKIFILKYLTSMTAYREFSRYFLQDNVLEHILLYLNIKESKEARLAFEALKYISSLLYFKNFAIKFIRGIGLEQLLKIPRRSFASVGVAICLYCLSKCEEAMSLLPDCMVTRVVNYALWLLEYSHYSGRDHVVMFFVLAFQFRAIVEEFDIQDGLKKLHNVFATETVLTSRFLDMNLDEKATLQHIFLAYKSYLEAHLFIKEKQLSMLQLNTNRSMLCSDTRTLPSYKICKLSPQEVEQKVDTLIQTMPFSPSWRPVDQLIQLGDIILLVKFIKFHNSANYEMTKVALGIMSIASVVPRVVLLFCDQIDLIGGNVSNGIQIFLEIANKKIDLYAELQKGALKTIVNCVCQPIQRPVYSSSFDATNSLAKRTKYESCEELLQKVWEIVEKSNGIQVLTQLIHMNFPKTDSDSVRALACKALVGMARSNTFRQKILKLPFIKDGQLEMLTRNPIAQQNIQEHILFKNSAFELLGVHSGISKHLVNNLEMTNDNIYRANVVAQTKINFNDHQLMQLVQKYLQSKGLSITSSVSMSNPIQASQSTPLTTADPSLSLDESRFLQNNISISQIQKEPVREYFRDEQINTPILISPHTESSFVTSEQYPVSLESIVTKYLTNQHALCKNLVATCPQFNLLVPHKCPDPKPKIHNAKNFAMRNYMRQAGYLSNGYDQKLIHSRFYPAKAICISSSDCSTCVKYLSDQRIVVSSYFGKVCIYNVQTLTEENHFNVKYGIIGNIEINRSGNIILTSSSKEKYYSTTWALDTNFKHLYNFDNVHHLEFSKTIQNKLVASKYLNAIIFDVNTGIPLMKLTPTVSNQYISENRATFSFNDNLVLCDGVLFDINSGKRIHRLVKFDEIQNGVFHPNGLEIVSNTKVWDMRTFRVLHTVPALNHGRITFSPVHNVIYCSMLEHKYNKNNISFDTVDASDYSSIATIDIKRKLYNLAVNKYDTQIAIVEEIARSQYGAKRSVVSLYDVGRKKIYEDEGEVENDIEALDKNK